MFPISAGGISVPTESDCGREASRRFSGLPEAAGVPARSVVRSAGEESMPESDATDNKKQAPLTQDPWHDKVLGDAIGYTKGLVAILDSLNEGFRRRGREIEELRDR